MPRDDSDNVVRQLWVYARMDEGLLDSERRVRPTSVASGGSGSECGVDTSDRGSAPCSVVYPDDWDAKDYSEWADGVNQAQTDRMRWEQEVDEIYAAEQLERQVALEDERRNDR